MSTNNNLIDRTEVLKVLQISGPTLAKYIKAGFIKPTKYSVTGRHLFDVEYINHIAEKLQQDKVENKALVSPTEAASILGVCNATIAEYERKGYLIVAKRPTTHRKLYSRESVDALMNKGRDKYLTTEELSREFKCSPALIAFLDSEGVIKSEKKTHTNTKFYSEETRNKLRELFDEEG